MPQEIKKDVHTVKIMHSIVSDHRGIESPKVLGTLKVVKMVQLRSKAFERVASILGHATKLCGEDDIYYRVV